jgi:hypothetical protein
MSTLTVLYITLIHYVLGEHLPHYVMIIDNGLTMRPVMIKVSQGRFPPGFQVSI